jgi:hypothetical protein
MGCLFYPRKQTSLRQRQKASAANVAKSAGDRKRDGSNKTIVMGMKERGGRMPSLLAILYRRFRIPA